MKNKGIPISQSLAKELVLQILEHNEILNDEEVKEKIESISFRYSHNTNRALQSKIVIDKDCRLFFLDYSDKEVKMAYLPKTVFFFFLLHPEGIEFRRMKFYEQELSAIYQAVSANKNIEAGKIRMCLSNLLNPTNNRIYEICSVMKRELQKVVPAHCMQHYCIIGKRGKTRFIEIDRKLVLVENEVLKKISDQ